MIFGNIKDLQAYLPSDVWKYVSKFILTVSPDTKEGVYELYGQKIYAKVMSYDTKKPEDCRIEAHDRYIDIQSSLIGGEGISIFPREKLDVESCNELEDVTFFKADIQPYALCKNHPGYFTILLPEDAHRPQEHMDVCKWVKKFVIKVDIVLWNWRF